MLPTETFADLDTGLPDTLPFRRADALEAGVTDPQLRHYVDRGLLRRITRGVYVASNIPDSIDLRCHALGLIVPADAFVCDHTAAWLYRGNGSLRPNEHLSIPEIAYFRPSKHRARRGPLTRSGERAVIDTDLRDLGVVRATTPLRTAVDLGRLQHSRDLRLWGMDNMLMTGEFDHDELLGEIPRFKGERGVVGLRALAPLAQLGSQSFGESALRLRWYDAGLPRPVLQHRVMLADNRVCFLDLSLPDLRFAAEYDGEEHHSTDKQRAHDDLRRNRLSAEDGWQIEVFTKFDVFGIKADATARLRQAVRAARSSYGLRSWVL